MWLVFYPLSINIFPMDVSVFVVFCDSPRSIISELTYPFSSIGPRECSLTIIFPIPPFSHIFVSTRISRYPLSILYTILEFPFILTSIRPSVCSLTIIFRILKLPYILNSIRKSVCSLTIFFPILPFPNILVSI